VLNPADAARLGVADGDGVRTCGIDKSLAVRVNAALPGWHGAYRAFAGLWSVAPAAASFERDPDFTPPVRIITRQ
jgi:hypothetical protein